MLKAPCLERKLFEFYLKHLNVRLEAYAFGASARNSGHEAPENASLPTTKDTIWSNDVDSAPESVAVLYHTRSGKSEPRNYVIWKADAFLSQWIYHSSQLVLISSQVAQKYECIAQ